MAKVNGKLPKTGKKPPHEIYQDLFIQQKDNELELTESFVAKKRALFAQLPPPGYLELQQLDMIYATLNEKLREKVPRDTVQTFEKLLEAANSAEESMKSVKKRIRCNFCRHPGHTADVCRKKADAKNESGDISLRPGLRSTIQFQIDDITDVGIVGSAAESCVMSHKLFMKLKARGYQFRQCHDRVNSHETDFLRITCDVKAGGRVIPTTFVYFPGANEPDNMLGIPFIRPLTIYFGGRNIWYFSDNPTKTFPLLKEKPKNDNVFRIGLLTFG